MGDLAKATVRLLDKITEFIGYGIARLEKDHGPVHGKKKAKGKK